jgi:hypothetical protein
MMCGRYQDGDGQWIPTKLTCFLQDGQSLTCEGTDGDENSDPRQHVHSEHCPLLELLATRCKLQQPDEFEARADKL